MRIKLLIIFVLFLPVWGWALTGLDVMDSVVQTKPVKEEEPPLKEKVKYSAKDSIRFDISTQKLYLYCNAEVAYQDLKMNAGYIELDMHKNVAFATGRKDSAGKEVELPVFNEGSQAFKSHQMSYNFQTKKGLISQVVTKEADGYIHGSLVKKDSTNVVFIKSGRYTTCDLDTPHFYIQAQKLKVIPDDKIVTGPAYLVINGIPTPLAVPFGFFPNKKGRKSGLIIPTYGNSPTQGFFLSNGGYYWGISDMMDLALTGNIYTRGSWGAQTHINYVKKYKYSGSFDFKFSSFIVGDPLFKPGGELYANGMPLFNTSDPLTNYSATNSFMINWTHREDSKADPGSTFSASVNAGSSNYNSLNSTTPSVYLNNSLNSNINYSKMWQGTPFNLSIAARQSQNTINHSIDLSLPQIDFSMNRIYPFKDQNDPVAHWYDKIGVSYSAEVINNINTYDSLFLKPQMFRAMQNGFHHSVPISTSFNAFKYFTITPSITYNGSGYYETIRENWAPGMKSIATDTVRGFNMENDFNLSTNINTKIYGNYQFRKGYFRHIRHLVIPNLAFTYRPDFSTPFWGYYKTVNAIDTTGHAYSQAYTKFANGIYGAPPTGRSDLISWSINNTIEAKVYDPKDSVNHLKKISIIDMLSISSGYNAALSSFQWQTIAINARTKLFKVLDINFTSAFDPYQMDAQGNRLNDLQFNKNGSIGRLTAYTIALGTTLKSKSKVGDKKPDGSSNNGSGSSNSSKVEFASRPPGSYVDFSIPWSLNAFFNYNYSKPSTTAAATETQSLTFNGDFSMTKKWKIGFTSGYDFTANALTYTQLNIYRDLHCWEMKVTWVPFGPREMYMLTINVKSAMLKDLKLTRTRQWYDFQ